MLGQQAPKTWAVLSSILLLVGALLTGGGIVAVTHGRPSGFMIVTVLLMGLLLTERLGASPASIVAAGLGAIVMALALVRYNRSDPFQRPPSPATAR